jgi:rare lipoprotein A
MRMQQAIGLSLALLVGSTAAMAKEAQSGRDQPVPSIKAKPARVETASGKSSSKRHRANGRAVARSEPRPSFPARQEAGQLPPPDRYIGPVQVIGRREIGSAAWYGGYHLGRRTASGERLDAVHPTAAHRSLPLHSLVRVTNLSNGRSIIATINDRGPVSRSLLIDVSPCVADELEMRGAGIATVAVEPVARAAPASQAARP